jgi:hypothetical protein
LQGSDCSASELLCEEELLLLDLLASGRLQQWLRSPAQAPWLTDLSGGDSPCRVDSPRRRYSVRMREALVSREGQPSLAGGRLLRLVLMLPRPVRCRQECHTMLRCCLGKARLVHTLVTRSNSSLIQVVQA